MKAQFALVEKNFKHYIIFIEDIANHTGGCTITNDAEAVYKHIQDLYLNNWRVVYKDTDNEWWEIIKVIATDCEYIRFEKWHGLEWDILKR